MSINFAAKTIHIKGQDVSLYPSHARQLISDEQGAIAWQ